MAICSGNIKRVQVPDASLRGTTLGQLQTKLLSYPPSLFITCRSLAPIFRVAFATASTLQFVSGMSYMAAVVLVQEPVEAMAYATLVTLLQVPCTFESSDVVPFGHVTYLVNKLCSSLQQRAPHLNFMLVCMHRNSKLHRQDYIPTAPMRPAWSAARPCRPTKIVASAIKSNRALNASDATCLYTNEWSFYATLSETSTRL